MIWVKKFLTDLDLVKVRLDLPVTSLVDWCPPIAPFVKVNFDAALDHRTGVSCAGIVARNSHGEVLESKSILQTDVGSVFVANAEGFACLQAVLLGHQEGFPFVHVERDAQSIVLKCAASTPDKSEISGIIHSVQELKRCFQSISFSHIHRSGNVLAHALATFSLHLRSEMYLIDCLPSFLADTRQERRPQEPD